MARMGVGDGRGFAVSDWALVDLFGLCALCMARPWTVRVESVQGDRLEAPSLCESCFLAVLAASKDTERFWSVRRLVGAPESQVCRRHG
jgi:hypothetical protein